jgi:hypothetical protein
MIVYVSDLLISVLNLYISVSYSCPESYNFVFETGTRVFDCEDDGPSSAHSVSMHLSLRLDDEKDIHQSFCSKTVTLDGKKSGICSIIGTLSDIIGRALFGWTIFWAEMTMGTRKERKIRTWRQKLADLIDFWIYHRQPYSVQLPISLINFCLNRVIALSHTTSIQTINFKQFNCIMIICKGQLLLHWIQWTKKSLWSDKIF